MQLRRSLFWDTNPARIDIKKNASYIIERILDFGNDQEVRWLWKTYPREVLKSVVTTSKNLHDSSKSLWIRILQL